MPFFHHQTDELRELKPSEKSIIFLIIIGSSLACFDFIAHIYFIEYIFQAFFPSQLPDWLKILSILGIVTSSYIFRLVGGMIIADIGDRFGRRQMLIFSWAMIAFSTLSIALLPTYQHIGSLALMLFLLLRLIQGFAFGGVIPISWVYVAEQVPRSHIGLASGALMAGLVLSIILNSILIHSLTKLLTLAQMIDYGWRIPFLIGGLGSFLVLMLRRHLTETPVWLNAKRQQKIVRGYPLRVIFRKYRYGLCTTFLLAWFTVSLFSIVLLLLPNIGEIYFDIESNVINIASGLGAFFMILGCVTFGYLADRINSGTLLMVGCTALITSSLVFFNYINNGSDYLFLGYAFLGFCSGIIGMIPSICIRLFPAEVRFSGISFCYNMTYVLTSILTALLVGYATAYLSFIPLLYMVFICVIMIIVGLYLNNLHGLYRMEKYDN